MTSRIPYNGHIKSKGVCTMKKYFAALLLAAILLASVSALAGSWIVVAIDGSTHIRLGPSLYCTDIGVLDRGYYLYATGNVEYDDRGVAWYEVYTDCDFTAWVSSRYTDLRYR